MRLLMYSRASSEGNVARYSSKMWARKWPTRNCTKRFSRNAYTFFFLNLLYTSTKNVLPSFDVSLYT